MRLLRAPRAVGQRAIGQYAVYPPYSTSLGCNCGSGFGSDPPPDQGGAPVGMANPAAVYCSEHGGQWRMAKDPKTGNEYGMCVFPDGSECEEWAFSRGECKPGAKPAAQPSASGTFFMAAVLGFAAGALAGSFK